MGRSSGESIPPHPRDGSISLVGILPEDWVILD